MSPPWKKIQLPHLRVPELDRSICGCSLETASKIIGWFYLSFGVLTVLTSIFLNFGIPHLFEEHHDGEEMDTDTKKSMEAVRFSVAVILSFMALFGVVQILISLLLLKGIYEKKSSYVWPWIVCQLVLEACEFTFELLFNNRISEEISLEEYIINFIIELFGLLLFIYCVWLVYSFYRQLKRQDDDLPAYQSHVYPV